MSRAKPEVVAVYFRDHKSGNIALCVGGGYS